MLSRQVRKLEKVADHETVFLHHYPWLLERAVRLAHGTREEAHDLVQDLYVRFVLSKSDIDTSDEERLRGYLFRALQNLLTDRHRSRGSDPLTNHETVDYDSMESALAAVDRSGLLYIRSELSGICEYACLRRRTSRAGSVLILRFFLGYFPSEIVALLKTTPAAVHKLIETARLEAKAYLDRPESLHFVGQESKPKGRFSKRFLSDDPTVLFAELRNRIFATEEGNCFRPEELSNLYTDCTGEQLTTQQVAHLVSCRKCLERANQLLNFPNLSNRFPDDPTHSGKGSTPLRALSIQKPDTTGSMRRRLQATLEHRPRNLEVAIDGQIRGAQKINSAVSDFRVVLSPTAQPKFISILSDLGHSLLYLDLENHESDDVSPSRAEVRLSDDRILVVDVSMDGGAPVVYVSYHDPLLEVADLSWAFSDELQPSTATEPQRQPAALVQPELVGGLSRKIAFLRTLLSKRTPLSVAFTVSLAAILGMLVLENWHNKSDARPVSSASSILSKSHQATLGAIPARGAAKQTLSLEIRGTGGRLIESATVESLRSTAPARRAVRMFGPGRKLLAGRWEDDHQTLTTYSVGEGIRHSVNHGRDGLAASETWSHVPDANDFQTLTADVSNLQLHTRDDEYEVVYTPAASLSRAALVYADLVVAKNTLRPTEETLRLRDGKEVREYRFHEVSYETIPASRVMKSDFEPDPSLTSGTKAAVLATPELVTTAHVVLAALEVLNNLGPDVEQMINLERRSDGGIEVNGVVPTSDQKLSIVRRLNQLRGAEQLKLDLHSNDEPMPPPSNAKPVRLEASSPVAIDTQVVPFDAEIRSALSSKGVEGSELETRVRKFSSEVVLNGGQLHRSAWNIAQIAARDFTSQELRAMLPEERIAWGALLQKHMRSYRYQLQSLHSILTPVWSDQLAKSSPHRQTFTIRDAVEMQEASIVLNHDSERLDRLLTEGFTLTPVHSTTNTNFSEIAELISDLDEEAGTLQGTIERIQSVEQAENHQ